MLSSVVSRLREKATSAKTNAIGHQDLEKRKRKRDNDSQDDDCIITDVIQTPPVKRQKALNKDGKRTFVRTVSEFFTAMSKMAWKDKYFWRSQSQLDNKEESENTALQVDLSEAENKMQRYTKNITDTKKNSDYKTDNAGSDRIFMTPAHRVPSQPILIVDDDDDDVSSEISFVGKRSAFSVEKRHLHKARPSSLEKTKVFSSPQSTASKLGRVQETYPVHDVSWNSGYQEGTSRNNIASPVLATDHIIRIDERNKYQELLARVTGCVFPEPPAISESRLLKSFQQSVRSDSSLLRERNTQVRLSKSSLRPGSSSLPDPSPLRYSSSQPRISSFKINPSPAKPQSDKNPSSQHPLKDVVDLTSSPEVSIDTPKHQSSRSVELVSSIKALDGDWIKKWREAIDPVTLERERRIRVEERKRQFLKEQREKETQELQKQFEHQEEHDEEDLLPVLTDEMEAQVDAAFSAGAPATPLVEGFNMIVTKADIATLKDTTWLNDEVINFYLNLVMERSKQPSYCKVHAFNTFFYPKLLQGYIRVKRWTKKVDIFSMDLLVIPIHLEYHWCLAVVDFRAKCISYFDSLRGKNPQCLSALRQYLQEESKDKKKAPFDLRSWTEKSPQDLPQQLNGCDCGVFACKYAEYISRGAPFNFSQEHMPYFRRRMVFEILNKKLM